MMWLAYPLSFLCLQSNCVCKEDVLLTRMHEAGSHDRMIHFAQGPPTKRHLVKPERVLIYTKKMEVRWRDLEAGLQGVRSLDDVIRIDLHFLCRHVHTRTSAIANPTQRAVHSEYPNKECYRVSNFHFMARFTSMAGFDQG